MYGECVLFEGLDMDRLEVGEMVKPSTAKSSSLTRKYYGDGARNVVSSVLNVEPWLSASTLSVRSTLSSWTTTSHFAKVYIRPSFIEVCLNDPREEKEGLWKDISISCGSYTPGMDSSTPRYEQGGEFWKVIMCEATTTRIGNLDVIHFIAGNTVQNDGSAAP